MCPVSWCLCTGQATAGLCGACLQVIDIYQPQSWRYIEEHLHDILGKQCAEYGDTEGALRHCTALLDCAHRPASAQQHYVDQFLAAVQKVAQTKQVRLMYDTRYHC